MRYIIIVLLFLWSGSFKAQLNTDVNQYMVFQPLVNFASASSYVNPTGALFYRNQWVGFPSAPINMGIALVLPWEKKNSTVGMKMFRDQIGVRSSNQITLDYSYRFKLKQQNYLAFSLSPKMTFYQGNYSNLVLTDIVDQSAVDFQVGAVPNFEFGSYYFKNNFYVGFTLPQLLKNEISAQLGTSTTLFEATSLAPVIHSGYKFDLKNKQSLTVSTLLKSASGTASHIDLNAMYRFADDKIGVGASYRTSKHVLGVLSVSPIDRLLISYSYQITFSGLSSSQSGSHEVLLSCSIDNAKELVKINAPRF